jgi:hypothetical protein
MPFQDQNFNLKIEEKMSFWGNIYRQRRKKRYWMHLSEISIKQNLTEADVKFELVKFCYIFFILYAINDILLKTVKNNIVACLCNVFSDVLFHKMLSSSNQCNQSTIIVLNSLLIVLPKRL